MVPDGAHPIVKHQFVFFIFTASFVLDTVYELEYSIAPRAMRDPGANQDANQDVNRDANRDASQDANRVGNLSARMQLLALVLLVSVISTFHYSF